MSTWPCGPSGVIHLSQHMYIAMWHGAMWRGADLCTVALPKELAAVHLMRAAAAAADMSLPFAIDC